MSSTLSIAIPAQFALPAVQAFAGSFGSVGAIVRPLLGLGTLIALLMIFKPLLLGVARATLLTIKPRLSLEQRRERRLLRSVLKINRMAREMEHVHPSLASELRSIACRG